MINSSIRIIRYIFAIIAVVFIAQTADTGLSLEAILLAVILGISLSNRALKRNQSFKKIFLYSALSFLAFELVVTVFTNFTGTSENPFYDLNPYVLQTKFELLFAIYLIVLVENLLFWTISSTLFFEVLGTGTFLIVALKGHRDYHIDIPSSISSLTWKVQTIQRLGLEPPELLAIISIFFALLTLLYSYLSSKRILYGNKNKILTSGHPRILQTAGAFAFLIACLIISSKVIFDRYSKDLSQVMNGVGEGTNISQGQSNLGFNKASTPSKQPAALLRLQNSYDKNPWAPMMYLREAALSDFAGKEIVKAGTDFDKDAPLINPNTPYYLSPPANEAERSNILQAIYVLSDKATPFSLDAPLYFKPIKNPNPKRFRYAYISMSSAPIEPLSTLQDRLVGEETWPKETWEHYLRAPGSNDLLELTSLSSEISETTPLTSKNGEDLRYALLSKKLTENLLTPMGKVSAVIKYLSEQSIYVLEPNHDVTKNGDPVAPYLFPKAKRGYCVHFAHSAVYLLRLAGIPARIGTGYLVDLQYAKGGDILVQMGDRHAWSEVYVRGKGWMVFDVTPQKAENDQVPIPDQDLLEQLMSEIDPIELLDGVPPAPEKKDNEKSAVEKLIDSKILESLAKSGPYLFFMFLILKIWLRHSWRLPSSKRTKLKRLYRAYISTLEDIGKRRYYGDTRMEFSSKLKTNLQIDAEAIFKDYLALTYSNQSSEIALKKAELYLTSLKAYFSGIKGWALFTISYLNPVSLPLLFKRRKSSKAILSFLFLVSVFNIVNVSKLEAQTDIIKEDATTNPDAIKSTDILLEEALALFKEGKGIDARAKLEIAIEKSPNDFRPFLFLGQYYLTEVAHFKLAYRYIAKAKLLFETSHPDLREIISDLALQNQHSLLLYLLSEAQLNLDQYQDSLETLNEYGKIYQSEWYPGQKAWVLMKLKKIDEAISVSKNGLLEGADPKRTWNILGILLSISGEREMSINAFQKAVEYEFRLSFQPQVATPLNNAGEVYRELFKDAYAESAWKDALSYPDGCEHILPSVNLSILYTDQLRLFQAEQTLKNFEACYAQKPEKKDSEHRTILALARGKLKLLSNDLEAGEKLLNIASDDQQWFGKIGTNENDVKFASWMIQGLLFKLKANRLKQYATDSMVESLKNYSESKVLEYKTALLERKARIFAVEELDDFEDLSIRHTDTMIVYPLLGTILDGYGSTSLENRFNRIRKKDNRDSINYYYDLYLADAYYDEGSYDKATQKYSTVLSSLPAHERLIKAQALSGKIKSNIASSWWWSKDSVISSSKSELEELYKVLPVMLPLNNLPLPVSFESSSEINLKEHIKDGLFNGALTLCDQNCAYRLVLTKEGDKGYYLQLFDTSSNRILASKKYTEGESSKSKENTKNDQASNLAEFINSFVDEIFSFKEDANGTSLPRIPFMKG
jgi:tetratricopeptide (TPR) repeat protein